jgi:hypothetical protein
MALNVVQLIAPYASGQTIPGLVTGVTEGTALTISASGVISVNPATSTTLGAVIPDGTTIGVDSAGVISVLDPALPTLIYFDSLASSFDGVQTTFTLTIGGVASGPSPSSNIQVFLGGVAQEFGDAYTISGDQISFSEAPEFQTNFVANTIGSTSAQESFVYFDDISTAFDGATTSFQLTVGGVVTPVSTPTISVFLGGTLQAPGGAYNVSGSTITFTEAPLFGTRFIATVIA